MENNLDRRAALNKMLAATSNAFGSKRPDDFDYVAEIQGQLARQKLANEREYTRWHLQDDALRLFAQAYAICGDGDADFPHDIEEELNELRDGEEPCVETAWEFTVKLFTQMR